MATGGRSLVKRRNQKPNQQKLPTRIPISTIEGRYTPHAKGSYSWEREVTMITNLSNHIPMLIRREMMNSAGIECLTRLNQRRKGTIPLHTNIVQVAHQYGPNRRFR